MWKWKEKNRELDLYQSGLHDSKGVTARNWRKILGLLEGVICIYIYGVRWKLKIYLVLHIEMAN